MEEAPNENPVITEITLLISQPISIKIANKLPNPRIPKPTTPIPITEPPVKAISSAFARLVLAALVVRTFAFVATRIPKYPAKAEQKAPIINERAIIQDEVVLSAVTASKIDTHITNMASTLYSARKKAMAPSGIALAMAAILGVPSSCLDTHADFQNMYISDSTPKNGME